MKNFAELEASNDWGKTTGIFINESWTTDIVLFTNNDETVPVFSISLAFKTTNANSSGCNLAHGRCFHSSVHSMVGYLAVETTCDTNNEIQNLYATFAADTEETNEDARTERPCHCRKRREGWD